MAEEGDDDDDDEDWEKETGEVVTTKDELEAIKRQEEGRQRYREMYGGTAEEIARRYEELSEVQDLEERHYQTMDTLVQNTQVAQQSLLPSAKDPKIFMIKCTPGKEESLVMAIMNKTIDVYEKTKIMKVKSAFSGSARGYVFVEALSDTLVREIILGLKGLYMSRIQQLPVHQMTSVLKVKVMVEPLKVGDFVRIKRGPLKGDLVRIVSLKEGHTKAEIQAVPRIDYDEEKEALSGERQVKVNAGRKLRPIQQLFNSELAFSIAGSDIDRDRSSGFYQWRGNTYKDGFLIKTVDINAYIQRTNVNPTLEELKFFAVLAMQQENDEVNTSALYRPPEALDVNKQLKALLNSLEGVQTIPFVPGDMIQVLSGELVGMIGRVIAVFDSRKVLRIEALSPKMTAPLEVEESLVTKYIEVGAHVKVMGGQYVGHTGRVVAMNMGDGDPIAVVVSDGSKSEMYCNVSLLQVTDEIALGRSSLGGFQKDDLVQLNENEVGMVIDVGLEALRILTQLENVKDIHPNEVRGKIDPRRQQKVFDVDQKSFGVGDSAQVVSGVHERSTGTVRHVFKGTVWLYSDNYFKNSGVMVVKPRCCRLVGSLHTGRAPSTLSAAAPGSGNSSQSHASTPSSAMGSRQMGGPNGMGGRGGGPGSRFAKDPLIGATVRITKGQYRGLSAQVANGENGFYQLEILAKMKKVTLPASNFIQEGDEKGRLRSVVPGDSSVRSHLTGGYDRDPFGIPGTPFVGMQTPAYNGSETPRIGSETPRLGSETPSYNAFMFTPRRAEDTDSSNWGDMDTGMSDFGTPAQRAAPPSSFSSSATPTASAASSSAAVASAAPPSGGASSSDTSRWMENMVVLVTDVHVNTGRLAVIRRLPTASDPQVVLQLRDGLGKLTGSEFSLPMSSVSAAKPSKGATVRILSGPHEGLMGTVKVRRRASAFCFVYRQWLTVALSSHPVQMTTQNRLIANVEGHPATTLEPSSVLWLNHSNTNE